MSEILKAYLAANSRGEYLNTLKNVLGIGGNDLIPEGLYCHYQAERWKDGFMHMAPCPYWDVITNEQGFPVEWCHLLNAELNIQDRVKDCDINMGDDDFL